MTGRTWGGTALLTLAGFMLVGFLRSDASMTSLTTMFALIVAVGIPAAGGVALIGGVGRGRRARVARLRDQTIEAEILRLAIQQGGKLTAVEVATALALPPETAKMSLDSLVQREVAELEITDRGVIVYSFHDARHAGGKHSARGILDA